MEQLPAAKKQFQKAIAVEPGSPMAVEAKRFLDRLGNVGTK